MERDFTAAMFSRKLNFGKYVDISVGFGRSCVNAAGVLRLLPSGCLGLSWLLVCQCEGSCFLCY
jgi:hypothetical protein